MSQDTDSLRAGPPSPKSEDHQSDQKAKDASDQKAKRIILDDAESEVARGLAALVPDDHSRPQGERAPKRVRLC